MGGGYPSGASALDPNFFSGGGTAGAESSEGRYPGPASELGRGGGWDNIPSSPPPVTPSAPQPATPPAVTYYGPSTPLL